MIKIISVVLIAVIAFLVHPIVGYAVSVAILAVFFYSVLPVYYSVKGNEAYNTGNHGDAVKWYEKAMKNKAVSDAQKITYGVLLMKLGNFEKAEKLFSTVIRNKLAKPEMTLKARQYRVIAYDRLGNFEDSREDAKDILNTYKNSVTYGIMGYIANCDSTDYDENLKLCLEAYDYNSDDRDICDNLTVAYINCKMYDKAKEIAEQVVKSNPKFVEGYYHLAQIELALGNKKSAIDALEKIKDCNRSSLTTVSEEDIIKLTEEANA